MKLAILSAVYEPMVYSRRLPRIASTGRVTLRLTPEQRDLLIGSKETSKDLGHSLHRAPVSKGEVAIRVTQDELYRLINAAANHHPSDKKDERKLESLLRYLESMADRFAQPDEAEDMDPSPNNPE